MAPRTNEAARFRGSGSVANSFATNHKDVGHKASRTIGTIFAASLLRSSPVLFRRPHADGQCVDAKWMASVRTFDHDIYRHVNHSEDFLKERGQERTERINKNTSRIRSSTCNKLGGAESQGTLTGSGAGMVARCAA